MSKIKTEMNEIENREQFKKSMKWKKQWSIINEHNNISESQNNNAE